MIYKLASYLNLNDEKIYMIDPKNLLMIMLKLNLIDVDNNDNLIFYVEDRVKQLILNYYKTQEYIISSLTESSFNNNTFKYIKSLKLFKFLHNHLLKCDRCF